MFQEMHKDFFHGVDVPLVLSAIKRTKFKLTPEVLRAAQDAVADAIILHQPERQALNGWVCNYIRYRLRAYVAKEQGQSSIAKKHAPKYLLSLDAQISTDEDSPSLHELVASPENVEESVMHNVLKTKLKEAINTLDERGQFVINFFLQANKPDRCGRELGDALAEKQMVAYKQGNSNKRSRAKQLIHEYLSKMKNALEKMGIDSETI